MPISPNRTDGYAKWQVRVLAFAVFVFNTTEFVPIALLSDIGASFHKTQADVGIMVGLYAAIVAVLSLPAMLITAKIERKSLLVGLFIVFTVSHLLSEMSKSFEQLVVSRVLVALCHAVFWSITASLAIRLAPKGQQTQALGVIALGGSLAMMMGIPIGRVLGGYLAWQTTFGVIAVMGLVVATLCAWLLPLLPAQNTGNLASLPMLLKNKSVLGLYTVLMCCVAAHFTVYSYIEPLVSELIEVQWVTPTLLAFGVAGLLSSGIFGRWYDSYKAIFLLGMMGLFGASLVLVYPFAVLGMGFLFVGFSVIWGIGVMSIGLALQIQILQKSKAYQDVAMAIFSGLYNAGIAMGAIIGAVIIERIGVSFVGFVGAVMVLMAVVSYAVLIRLSFK